MNLDVKREIRKTNDYLFRNTSALTGGIRVRHEKHSSFYQLEVTIDRKTVIKKEIRTSNNLLTHVMRLGDKRFWYQYPVLKEMC